MELSGVLPVIQTPWNDDWSLDRPTLRREIDWNFECGVDGIVIAMVSEVLRLTDDERAELVAEVVGAVAGRGPVIASAGAESTFQAVRHARRAAAAGADALMAIPPGLTRSSAEELHGYYRAILEATPLPVIVQDASGYVGNAIPLDVQVELVDGFPGRVHFKPESLPYGPTVGALRAALGSRARIFDGTGGIALMDTFPRGIDGTMPGGEIPWAQVALWRALQAGDTARATSIHEPLAAMLGMMVNLDSWLAMEKLLLVEQGVFRNTLVRGPVGYRLDEHTRAEMLRLLARLRQAVDG